MLMNIQQRGFTLFEVLVSMFITGVALLGLAMMEVHILKSSQASFNYTVATIRANSFVDAVWADLCNAQSASLSTYSSNWIAEVSAGGMSAATETSSDALDAAVTISWSDPRFTGDASNSTLTLEVKFPDSGCG